MPNFGGAATLIDIPKIDSPPTRAISDFIVWPSPRDGTGRSAACDGQPRGVLRVDGARLARVDALWRNGRSVMGRIVLGDTALEQVPMARARVNGRRRRAAARVFPVASGRRGGARRGAPRSARPRRVTAYGFVQCGRCPSRRWGGHRGGRACGPRGRASPSTAGCLGARCSNNPAATSWIAGRSGALGDGCPYEGRPALVAAGTRGTLPPPTARPGRDSVQP